MTSGPCRWYASRMVMRRLFLPVVAATSAISLILLPAGIEVFSSFPLVAALVTVGLLALGLPAALALRRRQARFGVAMPVLLLAGTIGGTAIMVTFLALAGVGGAFTLAPLGVLLGAPAGLLTAAIWSLMNRDLFADRSKA